MRRKDRPGSEEEGYDDQTRKPRPIMVKGSSRPGSSSARRAGRRRGRTSGSEGAESATLVAGIVLDRSIGDRILFVLRAQRDHGTLTRH